LYFQVKIGKEYMKIRMIEGKTFEKLKMCIADLLEQIDTLYAEPGNG
jgi:hypothetical protein